jgi:PhnB protein
MAVKPIPEGYHAVTPYLTVKGAAQLLDFITTVFAGKELFRMPRPDGTIGHAEVRIGDSMLMLAEASEQWPPMPAGLYVYVPDTDAAYQRALKAGATSLMEPADQFYGDRNAGVKDATGVTWWIATHVEDVPPSEMEKRAAASQKK